MNLQEESNEPDSGAVDQALPRDVAVTVEAGDSAGVAREPDDRDSQGRLVEDGVALAVAKGDTNETDRNAASGSIKKTITPRLVIALVFVVVVIAVVVVSIVVAKGDDSSPTPAVETETDADDYDEPDVSIDNSTVLPPPAPSSREQQIVDWLVPVSGDALFNQSSPRHQALQWIVHDDPLQLAVNETDVDMLMIVERYVMALFYLITGGQSGTWIHDLGFMSDAQTCHWSNTGTGQGIACNENGKVQSLTIHANNLAGTLPDELCVLKELEKIDLRSNFIHGPLPSSFNYCSHLRQITLHNNMLTGTIPDLSNLDLLALEVGFNHLSGPIPDYLARSPELFSFNAYDNMLTGTIPEFSQFILYLLTLGKNQLTGSIPSSLGSLVGLDTLMLDNNQLNGTIPSSLAQLGKATAFVMSSNAFSGPIPSELGQLAAIENLLMDANELSGQIPSELGSLTNLEHLFLSQNKLTGSIPSEFGQVTAIKGLYLSANELTGPIPSELGFLTNLEDLYFDRNKLTSSIPSELGQLAALRDLRMQDNMLSGSIPSELGSLATVELLLVHRNELTGPIPSELGLLPYLKYLYLQNNMMNGTIPTHLANLTQLQFFGLSNNSFTGSVEYFCNELPSPDPLPLFMADCLPQGNQEPELDCPCCTHCCNDVMGDLCETRELMECKEIASDLEEEEEKSARNTTTSARVNCMCPADADSVTCLETGCVRCNEDESLCYTDGSVVFGLDWDYRSIAIDYVHGRNESVLFQSAGALCLGSINGNYCDSCTRVVCDNDNNYDGGLLMGTALNCSNVGYGVLSDCSRDNEADDPFYPIWDSIRQLDTLEMVLPDRSPFSCMDLNTSAEY